ncbi:MAG: lysophospholipid acyltransferase family protein [Bacilli bacterium]|jgi:1-acyl-sn-glycerol-3-phosphate acyltransferase
MTKKNKKLPGARWYSYFFLYGLLKPFLFLYFHLFQNVHFKRNGHQIPKEPFFSIGNHHTNWDGFYHCIMFYSRFPHFIVHDEVFKNKEYAWIFGDFLGQVKRGRDSSDMEPILTFKRLLGSGQSVSVFPEGDIDMFGGTLPIDPSIAKMAKFLGAPIVLTRVHGAHLRAPRWSNLAHHSRITFEVSDVIPASEVKAMDLTYLLERIVKGITVSAYEDQMASPVRLWGRRRAEWLELGLYLCPRCRQYETLVSRGNHFVCTSCGLTGTVDQHLLLNTEPETYFIRPDDWDRWQKQELEAKIHEAPLGAHLFTLSGGTAAMVAGEQYFGIEEVPASARLYTDRLELHIKDQDLVCIRIEDIIASQVQYKDVFEITTKTKRYRLRRRFPKWSAYLWANCVKSLSKI